MLTRRLPSLGSAEYLRSSRRLDSQPRASAMQVAGMADYKTRMLLKTIVAVTSPGFESRALRSTSESSEAGPVPDNLRAHDYKPLDGSPMSSQCSVNGRRLITGPLPPGPAQFCARIIERLKRCQRRAQPPKARAVHAEP
jgi:hypothetical protein